MNKKAIALSMVMVLAIGMTCGCLGGHEIEGKWNLVKVRTTGEMMGVTIDETENYTDTWIEFKSDGTLAGGGEGSENFGTGEWAAVEDSDNQITITADGTSITMNYEVDGDELKLSYTMSGMTMTMYLEKA